MMSRILRWLFSAEIMGQLLVLAALLVLNAGISASLQNADTLQSGYFSGISLLAALIALGLSLRHVNAARASVGLTASGLLGVWILGAGLARPLLDFLRALILLIPEWVLALPAQLPPDTAAAARAWQTILAASAALQVRLQLWLAGLDRNVSVTDPLVRDMVWLLIVWLLSAWMGWFTGRRNALAVLLPPIGLLAMLISYSGRRVEALWLLVVILLLLMGLWNYRNRTTRWESTRVDYSDSIRYDVGQAVIFLSIAIGVIAFITPSISWRAIRDALRARDQNEVAEMLGVQQEQVPVQPAPGLTPSLPREHWLRGGFALSEKNVMTIRTGELPPVASPVFTAEAPRYYWRSVTYDRYLGGGWVTSSVVPQNLQAETPLIPGLLEGYRALHLDVDLAQPEGKLFWSGVLFSADVPVRADWRRPPRSNLFADPSALLQADLFAATSKASAYTAQSYVPVASVEELRLASTEYPEDISQRYLKLPGSVPGRVRQLAQEITRDRATAYDKAKAIEAYLRTYPYDLEVPAPPGGQDVADYFLFDLKKGYCDYYATAMVVLARASGVPARFVSGYSSGSYDPANAQYVVRELNAHSWAEVYFPGIGWIEFEPTAAQPEIQRAEKKAAVPDLPPDSATAELLKKARLRAALYWLSPGALLLSALFLYFTLIERWWYLRLAPAGAVEKIYGRLYRVGRPLAGQRTGAETAREFMQKLIQRIDQMRGPVRSRRSLLRTEDEIRFLTDLYQETLFSHRTVEQAEARRAWRAWRRLRVHLLFLRIQRSLDHSVLSRVRRLASAHRRPA